MAAVPLVVVVDAASIPAVVRLPPKNVIDGTMNQGPRKGRSVLAVDSQDDGDGVAPIAGQERPRTYVPTVTVGASPSPQVTVGSFGLQLRPPMDHFPPETPTVRPLEPLLKAMSVSKPMEPSRLPRQIIPLTTFSPTSAIFTYKNEPRQIIFRDATLE